MIVARASGPWDVADGPAKLALRSKLPGAYAFDRAAHALRLSRQHGIPAFELLPLALASSWLVNNPVPSPVFRRWLTPPLAGAWGRLLEVLGTGPWLTRSETERATVAEAALALGVEGHGAGAISKVLALLCPESVPLMPDAALSFAIEGATLAPAELDAQTAPAGALVPMMDWFNAAVAAHADALEVIAEMHGAVPLDGAQVLDRLLWFDSAGHRHFGKRT